MSLLLSAKEFERFAAWLENEARSAAGVAEQLAKVGGPATDVLAQNEKRYAAACLIVARKIRVTEHVEIGPSEVGGAEGGV